MASIFDDPRAVSNMGTAFTVGGQFLSAFSHIRAGRAERQAAAFEAAQLRESAGQAQAAGQYAAADAALRSKLVASRALAVAAASGGGASDPTVVSAIAGVAGEGAYRQALALYQGDERARELLTSADAAEYRGAVRASGQGRAAIGDVVNAGASAVAGGARTRSLLRDYQGSSLRTKYGGEGPQMASKDGGNDWAWDWMGNR